ncbi:MAG TPA: response regulator receiver domain [Bradyrhizobium sp.]|nr:response regulator receiver domain [Bradyrhizobium sp.]
MADAAYEAVVKETFETKPLRTVLMIDDEFPSFSDLADGENEANEKRFRQKDRAVTLYRAFQKRHMICDVENVASEVRTDRIRKSDLIILDYHLGPGDNNSDKSVEILRELSASKHFNTIVVYTNEPNLDKVWLDIIVSLSGGWTVLPADLKGAAQQHWERLSDERKLPGTSIEAMMAYARRREIRDLPKEVRAAAQKELTELDVPPKECGAIIEAMINKEIAGRSGKYAMEPQRRATGDWRDGSRWIQSGNAFVAILKKGDLTDDDVDPAGIMECLSRAFLAWRPNLVQILISEIQNILELDALATEDDHLKDPVTHTALWYYLLDSLGCIDPNAEPDVRVPLMAVIDKIVDGVRRRLSSDPELLSLASDALLGELRDMGWSQEDWPKPRHTSMLPASTSIARTTGLTTPAETLFRLNSFFSTERFRRAHLTTGTIFYDVKAEQYFVAASPACDLVARRPSRDQAWAHSIFPIAPMVAVLLHEDGRDSALSEAANGLHVFLENGSERKAFKIVTGAGSQPSYEFFMLKNEGRTRTHEGKIVFDAVRMVPKTIDGTPPVRSDTEREWVEDTFEVVDQLRGINAIRILQMTGQHLSRVGLDYVSLPTG